MWRVLWSTEKLGMARIAVFCIFFCLWACLCTGDLQADQKECQTQLTSLSSCISFVQGKDKSPSQDCCTNLKSVRSNKPKCLCILIKDTTTPALGLSINTTLALEMPSACKVNVNISECPALLNISPSSPDAKIFGVASNSSSSSSSSSVSTPSSKSSTSSASNFKGLLEINTHQGFYRMAALVVTVASVSFFNIGVGVL